MQQVLQYKQLNNKDMTKITYIPGEIANAAIDEHGNRKPVTRTQHIFDNAKGKSQAQINADADSTFALHQSEINALDSQNYESYTATSGQTLAQILPATGAVDTIYRVGFWDGSANSGAGGMDATVYSEYAWDAINERYYLMDVKTAIGEIFDISLYHASGGVLAEYEDLAAALGTNGANVPQVLRRGGMSVKFVQSPDNKYVQHRYMGTATTGTPNPFLDTANWQSVEEVTANTAYFSGNKKPTITIDGENIIVNMPTSSQISDLRIYDKYGSVLLHQRMAGEEFTIGKLKALVINSTGMSVVNRTDVGSAFILLENYYNGFAGMLAPYYYYNEIKDLKTNSATKTEVATVGKYHDLSAYFSGRKNPTIIKNGNDVIVTLPASSATSDLRVYDNSGTLVTYVRCAGDTFTLATGEVLIINESGELSKVSRTSVDNNFILLYNSAPSIDGLLAKYYYDEKVANVDSVPTKDSTKFVTSNGLNNVLADTAYFSGYNKPTFSRNDKSLIVELPAAVKTADLRIYDKKGNVLKTKRCAGEVFTLTALQTLVLNDDASFEVVMRTAVNNRWILIENDYPAVGGLLAKYYYYQIGEDETGILKLNPRSIYSTLIANLRVGRLLSQSTPRKEYFSFLHFSDLHGNVENLGRLMEFKAAYSSFINDVVCSGDIVTDNFEDDDVLSAYPSDIAIVGNHDAWVEAPLQDLDPEIQAIIDYSIDSTHHVIKQKPVYDKFFADYISNWNVTQPSDAANAGKCYFYKDYTNNTGAKLRLIFLDCMHYNVGEDVVNSVSSQNTWLTSVLNDAKTNNIPVAIFSHYFPAQGITKVECSYTTTDAVPYGYLSNIATETVNSFIAAGGEFICWLVGHSHLDLIGYPTNYPNQVFIAVDTAGLRAILGNSYRAAGSKSQDAFNIISFDTDDKLIKIVRIGNDTTRLETMKRRVVYRYADYTDPFEVTHQKGLVLSE